MTVDISAIVERARATAAGRAERDASVDQREHLQRMAAEFESMLLVQMLRDMRKAGDWGEGDDTDTLGADAMFETLDVELASHLAKAKGIGLQEELISAFDRMALAKSPAGAEGLPSLPTSNPLTAGPGSPVAPPVMIRDINAGPTPAPVHSDVSSGYGWRRDPFTQRGTFHQGVDVRAAYGEDVPAAAAGTVVFAGSQGGYGTTVVIEHQDGTRTRYAHLSAAVVVKDEAVQAGVPVGRAGRSGRATGPHLHFEAIGRDGQRIPPQQWASADAGRRALPGAPGSGVSRTAE
jgi:murein DD-endopeptidase MepM/ murein hydrolase activator NlpD